MVQFPTTARKTGCNTNNVLDKPLTFLGGTVLSFNASLGVGPTQESTLTVELINDCHISGASDPNHFPNGDYFYGAAKLGSPVFFSTCYNGAQSSPTGIVGSGYGGGCFNFGGILTNYSANQGNNGLTSTARVVDPRSLLENAIIITDSYLQGPIRDRNYFNVYSYYEYNILPTGLKQKFPVSGFMHSLAGNPYTVAGDDVYPLANGHGATNTLNGSTLLFPSGDWNKSDCSVFGSADSNERGMSGRKVLQALKNMRPLIYSPNYGEPYSPNLTTKEALANANKTKHEWNVMKLDMSTFPEPPPYYRVSGPSISILELLTQICEIRGEEFIVYLDPPDVPGQLPIIKIKTKKPDNPRKNQEIKSTILNFDGRSTELSFGEELRLDKNRTILIGESEHSLYESSYINHYFGEDSEGNPIVPVAFQDCGFEIAMEPNQLNDMLSCPLFDPDLHNAAIPLSEKILKRRVIISELDIRTALSSNELWKVRLGASNIESSDIKTIFPQHNSNTIDFNRVLRYNFNSIISPLVSEIFGRFGINVSTKFSTDKPPFTKDGGPKAIVDAAHQANAQHINSLNDKKAKDLDTIYDWLKNLGTTYYGKQYLVYLPIDVCSLPEGLYDENYFGLSPGFINDSYPSDYTPPECSGEINVNSPALSGKIYRNQLSSYNPTNDGGWIEPCTPALGLYEPELSFFKSDDFRVQPFARFDTEDIKISYRGNFLVDLDNLPSQEVLNGVSGSVGPNYSVRVISGVFGPEGELVYRYKKGVIAENFTIIKGSCGALDTSLINDDNYLLIKKYKQGENIFIDCGLPTKSGLIPSVLSTGNGVIKYDSIWTASTGDPTSIPVSVWVKNNINDTIYNFNTNATGIVSTGIIPWNNTNPYADNYWPSGIGSPPPPRQYYYDPDNRPSGSGNTALSAVVITFNDPCFKKLCNEGVNTNLVQLFQAYANLVEAKFPFSWSSRNSTNRLYVDGNYEETFKVPSGNLIQTANGVTSTVPIKLQITVIDSAGDLTTGSGVVDINNPPIYLSDSSSTAIFIKDVVGVSVNANTSGTFVILKNDGTILGGVVSGGNLGSRLLANYKVPSKCGYPIPSGKYVEAVDSASSNNKGYCPAADFPTAVCIPLRSNISCYGPWYSPNFFTSAGGIEFQKDNELSPWNYGSAQLMAHTAKQLVQEAQIALSEIETGSITTPGMPTLSLGFLDNGPNLSNINVIFGSNGITTNYSFSSYTPRFGGLKNLQNQQLKETYKNKQRAQKILKNRIINENKLLRKVGLAPSNNDIVVKPKLNEQSTLQRVLIGEMYDFSVIGTGIYSTGISCSCSCSGSGYINTSDIGQRTVVGTDTLEKTLLELRQGYSKKAFMSWDGLLSPVSISGDGELPMFVVKYTGYKFASNSSTILPIPPIYFKGTGNLDIKINQNYLNPLTNNFAPSGHHHVGSGAGHCIDILGRNSGIPGTGMIMNFYTKEEWANRYSQDYRFLGLKGPLVLHSWGYDTQGKPIPNAADHEQSIRKSGYFCNSGLKDQFLKDWLHKPSTWPVAPIDLRFDRERGVWVSPPQHQIVVAKVSDNIDPYGSGSGILINYGQNIYNSDGQLIDSSGDNSQANIIIEDRIGNALSKDDKGYAYFDTFSSKYLLLGGIQPIKIGKFTGFWSNEFGHNIKTINLYTQDPKGLNNPYAWIPARDKNNNPMTATVLNLFAYIPGKPNSDRELWCAIMPLSNYSGVYTDYSYTIPVDRTYDRLWLLLTAEV